MGFEASWRSVWLRLVAVGAFSLAVTFATPERASAQCVGDCNGDGSVTVDEIVTMVNIALGTGDVEACTAGDADTSGTITVDEIISATNNALNGCPMVAVCGNGMTGPGEDCDDGGVCIGGDNAGELCTSEEACEGNGICEGGIRIGTMCASDEDCPSSECIHCKPFGGDGCAANCTNEKTIAFNLVPGMTDGFDIAAGTSGVVVFSAFLTIPLELQGSLILTVGEERDGQIPAIVKTEDIDFPAIPVVSFACACVRGAVPKTCGGVGFLEDGITLSPDCTDDEEVCTRRSLPPCAVIHGEGNTASGTIGCNGLEGIDIAATLEDGELSVTLDGTGGPGSALIFTSIDIGIVVGPCTGSAAEYGADGEFCTADDPPNELSATGTGPTTTGEACGEIVSDAEPLGPECRSGSPMSCAAIGGDPGSLSGSCVTFALPVEGLPDPVGDIVATLSLCAQ